jgi:hypothetical protein
MVNYSVPHASKADVVRVGKVLGGPTIWTPEAHEEYVRIFRVAYDWRNSHQYPMQRIRHELGGKVRGLKVAGITAARTKRMASIRKKLKRSTITLTQIQDLGGCRAIVGSIGEVRALVDLYRSGASIHEIRKDQSYIDAPKLDGYRSHHFVLQFCGSAPLDEAYRGRRIEVQIRTRLQHAWATAVEAVGMVRNEDLKAGDGDTDWLRLFALMASEFAEVELCQLVPGTFDRHHRREEIRYLDAKLAAAKTLGKINSALKVAERVGPATANFFLVQYDGIEHTLRIRGYASPRSGSDQYSSDEDRHRTLDSVLVEVDKAENLREAYPNYFLDVGAFASSIMEITEAGNTRPVGMQSRDLSFLKTWRKSPR